MIKIENVEVTGWEHAIRGMRNPMNSWDKSDSVFLKGDYGTTYDILGRMCNHADNSTCYDGINDIGPNDHELMTKLSKAGTDHRKFMRMIVVYLDITAPLYWWKEFDTYKVGTVANSCSTMHKIHEFEFKKEDFSWEHLYTPYDDEDLGSDELTEYILTALNRYRTRYLETKDKKDWWQIIQLLPSSYNQKRTVMLNYEVLANMYHSRKNHKLDEWREFCQWIEKLPYSELITQQTANLDV